MAADLTGLDHAIAALAADGGLVVALLAAVLLGLRHATDPDHLTAVTALVAGRRRPSTRAAGALGAAWGAGHAATLLSIGVPLVLLQGTLPAVVERGAEAAAGIAIAALSLRLLWRWRSDVQPAARWRGHASPRARVPLAAFGIGALHGLGGSAGVTLLVVSAVPARPAAAVALGLFAGATAVSMALLSAALGRAVGTPRLAPGLARLAPILALLGIGFGCWYATAALLT